MNHNVSLAAGVLGQMLSQPVKPGEEPVQLKVIVANDEVTEADIRQLYNLPDSMDVEVIPEGEQAMKARLEGLLLNPRRPHLDIGIIGAGAGPKWSGMALAAACMAGMAEAAYRSGQGMSALAEAMDQLPEPATGIIRRPLLLTQQEPEFLTEAEVLEREEGSMVHDYDKADLEALARAAAKRARKAARKK